MKTKMDRAIAENPNIEEKTAMSAESSMKPSKTKAPSPAPSRSSPSPEDPSTSGTNRPESRSLSADKCPICLGVPVNESKTDACQHRFCFVCLVEWSKIKTQCPMCKTPFKQIIHDTKVDENGETFETFDVPEPAPPEPAPRRFRFHTTMGRERSELLRQIRELQTRLMIMDNARRIQDPFEQWRHNYHIGRIGSRGTGGLLEFHRARDAMIAAKAEQGRRLVNDSLRRYQELYDASEHTTREELIGNPEFRRLIYERGLRVLPMETDGRVRQCNPRFLRNNEAMLHRLVAWLTRELSILLHNNDQRVSAVTALIIEMLKRYDMNDEEFQARVRQQVPYFDHFLHEFSSFARSPYDLPEYDRRCEYQRRGTSPVPVEPGDRQVDANDNDVQVVAESARLHEAVQRQAEAVQRQTEAADRSTTAIHAAVANITAQITRFTQMTLPTWMQPSINLGMRIDAPGAPLAYNDPVVQVYEQQRAAAHSNRNRRSRSEDDSSDVQLISPPPASSTLNIDMSPERRSGLSRRRGLPANDVDGDVHNVSGEDIQLLPTPLHRAASSPNLRRQLDAIINAPSIPESSNAQRRFSIIDISSPTPSNDSAAAPMTRVRSQSPLPGPSHGGGYRASWATTTGKAPTTTDSSKSKMTTQQQPTYKYLDSDTSTPSPPQFRNTFRLIDEPLEMDDDDVIVDSASSGTTYGFVESAPNTPSPETSEFDLRQARRIEREVEDAIESGRLELRAELAAEEDYIGAIPPIPSAAQQESARQRSSNWSDDSDVEVLAELKPKHLRTPPLVELVDELDDDKDLAMDTTIKLEKDDGSEPSTSAASRSMKRKRSRTRSPSRDEGSSERRRHKKHKKHHKSSSSGSKKRRREDSSVEASDSDRRRQRHRRSHANIATDSSSSEE